MLSFFTVALIALFVAMTWFEAPTEPLVRHNLRPEKPGDDGLTPEIDERDERKAA